MAVNGVTVVGRSNINMEYFSVSRETSYESLLDFVSRLVEANPSESSIKMKFIFNSPKVLAPFEVLNDDDVQYLIQLPMAFVLNPVLHSSISDDFLIYNFQA
ncbi:hypothetical protein EZV62_001338 [Acer yangbiense]|uniref:Uncharacterized protein n=1 Tax=Acer yangbiense TaxID=1000413 RepID=A0A5C7IUL1_9ROSI|nr:hypothetical protein EZV62_001338 [Acer yangbiense]